MSVHYDDDPTVPPYPTCTPFAASVRHLYDVLSDFFTPEKISHPLRSEPILSWKIRDKLLAHMTAEQFLNVPVYLRNYKGVLLLETSQSFCRLPCQFFLEEQLSIFFFQC